MKGYFIPLLATSMLAFAISHVVRTNQTLPPPPPPVEPPRAAYDATVAGSGLVEARTENISIGAHRPGVVAEVLVTVGQRVTRGTPLFRLDDREVVAEWKVRQANLAIAEAQWNREEKLPRPEDVPISEAQLREAEANLAAQEDLLKRVQASYIRRAVSVEAFVQQRQSHVAAREKVARARAELDLLRAGAWAIDKAITWAKLAHARAQVDQSQTELTRLVVNASVDGDVLQVNVRPGEYVGTPPGQALVVLGDIRRLHVRVDIPEHEIPRFQPGTPAQANVRGTPGRRFPLEFVRVEPYVIPKRALTGDGTERVDNRVLQVIYAVVRADEPVYVGQQVDVFLEAKATEGNIKPVEASSDRDSSHPSENRFN
jgi:multidrug resistance efflux pump